MAGRLSVACVSFLAVLAFLLLFASGTHVEAATYKMGYSSELSCDGPDKLPGTVDDSCTPVAPYFARAAGLHADLVSYFDVWEADPKYSQYSLLATMGTPSTWQISTDKEIPDGAYVGDMFAISTLALMGGDCTATTPVTISLHDCSTDITDTIGWDEATSGENLTYGHKDGLPAGCLKYPQHVLDIVGDVQPRARYYGFTTVLGGMPPTQLNFMMFNPEQLSQLPNAPRPDFSDDLGYINFTVLDNPNIPAEATSSLDELCTPLGTTTNLLGLTGGEAVLTQDVPPVPNDDFTGTFWVHPEVDAGDCIVGDCCGDGVDNNDDGRVDEMCGIVRVTNPAANSGIYGTGSHMAGGYSESYRDADGDTIANNEDECPFDVDTYTLGVWDDADGDRINDVCDPLPNENTGPSPLYGDHDFDGWRNQADNCPLDYQTSQANDADDDGIGDICDLVDAGQGDIGLGPDDEDGEFLNDLQWGSICVEADDTDGDGWCDDTESMLGSCYDDSVSSCEDQGFEPGTDPEDSTPEYYGIDWAVNTTGESPPGVAPQSCDNYAYYDVNSLLAHGGVLPATDDDGDTVVNAAERGCIVHHWCLSNLDEDGDTNVNDGCPAIDTPEDPSCVNAIDDDPGDDGGSSTVNDGCPQKGNIPENAEVIDGLVDVDGDTDVDTDDDLAALAGHEIIDGFVDINDSGGIDDTDDGAWTETGYNVIDGYVDIDGDAAVPPDVDDDGFLDTLCANDVDDDGDTRVNDGCPTVGSDPESDECANDIDDDGDTAVNDGCPAKDDSEDVPDSDGDGVPDASDNCPNTPNPTQLDTDGDGKPGQQPPDAQPGPKFTWGGDACDQDDDQDKVKDVDEWAGSSSSSDPKNVCDPANFDLNQKGVEKGVINVMDVLMFSNKIFGMDCYAPDDYLLCEATYRSD